MQVKLAYGRTGLEIRLPDTAHVIRPRVVNGLPDEPEALKQAMRAPIGSSPLRQLLKPGNTVVIVHTDITRATPNDRIMPVLLEEIEAAGISGEDITLLNGLGTHRPQTNDELRGMLGGDVFDNYRCLQHDCHDDANLVSLGRTHLGHPVRVNRHYYEADVKILTGFIEPHLFAGFSGGPKAILPSLAGVESVFSNHAIKMISDERASWGITQGNPIWDEMREVALRTEPDFLLNVTLNSEGNITGVFAGEMLQAHEQGCRFVKDQALVAVDAPYDIVVTTNSGYPLDQNLYQSVKGMSAAARIVRQGGAIIIAAACEDGVPEHGLYSALLAQAGSPEEALATLLVPGLEKQDQWQVQIQAQIQMQAEVYVFSEGLTDQQIERALLKPCRSIGDTLSRLIEKCGPSARLCVMPDGPQTIPYVSNPARMDE